MYARILAGIDGSEHADHALRHAAGLAKSMGAELRIVHVVDMGVLPLAPELALDVGRLTKARRAEGEGLLAKAKADAGVPAQTRLLETATPAQPVAAVLAEEAAAWPAGVIVLGARGRGTVQRLLLGSVADGVARRSRVPVLLVH